MKLEQQVCSLELAKQLKELGAKQESLFCWVMYKKDCYKLEFQPLQRYVDDDVSAFISSELAEKILKKFPYPATLETRWYKNGGVRLNITFSYFYKGRLSEKRRVIYKKLLRYMIDEKYEGMSKTEADARAKIIIYLIKNKIIIL